MRTPEERRIAKELTELICRRAAEGRVRAHGYWELRVHGEKKTLTVDIDNSALFGLGAIKVHADYGQQFKAFKWGQKLAIRKIYRSLTKVDKKQNSIDSGNELVKVLRTEEDDLKNAAKDVKTWIS